MSDAMRADKPRRSHAWTLVRCRALQFKNSVDQQLTESPFQTLAVLVLLCLIGCALYVLLGMVLGHVHTWGLAGVVAQNEVFGHFFFLLALMLGFSNAVLAFGSLYGREEAGQLMTMPADARNVVLVKWIEGLFLSSWSFLLLGLPLMFAVAQRQNVSWLFYVLFVGHFLSFVLIPSALGVLAAWVVAMFSPRKPLTLALWVGCGLLAALVAWLYQISRSGVDADEWIRRVLHDLNFTRAAFWPSSWTARGVNHALRSSPQDVADSAFYLFATLANAAFVGWVVVNIVGRTWNEAYSRAQHGRAQPVIKSGWPTLVLCWALFFYLPRRLRIVMLKDIRNFTRDAAQWSQMVILLGLLAIYALNLERLPIQVTQPRIQSAVAFLNLTAICLILATFTSRFVYPLLSLESQQLWLIGLTPVRRVTLLFAKFLFATTVTGAAGLVVTWIAVTMLDYGPLWLRINLAVCLAVCVGLCSLAVGLGARYPVLHQRNPARIASGFGGNFNLMASMAFVALMMAGMALMLLSGMRRSIDLEGLIGGGWVVLAGMFAFTLIVAVTSLWVGAAHFRKLEC